MFDIIICGGGLTGTVAALAFSRNGLSIAIIEPKCKALRNTTTPVKKSKDYRSTAHLERAVDYLRGIGVWEKLSPYACPLETLSIVNVSNSNTPRESEKKIIFCATEVRKKQFGFNVPIEKSWEKLSEMVEEDERITTFFGCELQSYRVKNSSVIVSLSDGRELESRLLVGADGGDSKVREIAKIETVSKYTGQEALTFNIQHEMPHKNNSTEIYVNGGPFTIVPMKTEGQSHHSAVVWMQESELAHQLVELNSSAFKKRVQEWSRNTVGTIKTISKVNTKSIKIRIAKQIIAERVALIGEASHVLPPVGAQGFNLSISDILELDSLIRADPRKIGDKRMLSKYQLARMPEIIFKSCGVGLLNHLALSEKNLWQQFRASALNSISASSFLKQRLMQLGL